MEEKECNFIIYSFNEKDPTSIDSVQYTFMFHCFLAWLPIAENRQAQAFDAIAA